MLILKLDLTISLAKINLNKIFIKLIFNIKRHKLKDLKKNKFSLKILKC